MAGEELRPIILQLGAWGKQWTRRELEAGDLDVGLLMWDMRRRVDQSRLPDSRLESPAELRSRLPSWLQLSAFAAFDRRLG